MPNEVQTVSTLIGDGQEFIKRVQDNVNQAVRKSVAEQAAKVLAVAQDIVPVRTGNLKNSLKSQLEGDYAKVYADSKVAPYSRFVAYGSIHNRPNPFLDIAQEQCQKDFIPAIEANISETKDDD